MFFKMQGFKVINCEKYGCQTGALFFVRLDQEGNFSTESTLII